MRLRQGGKDTEEGKPEAAADGLKASKREVSGECPPEHQKQGPGQLRRSQGETWDVDGERATCKAKLTIYVVN